MQQTKKVVLFGLWFLGFMLVMRKMVAPMSGQDPVVVEATPAPVLGAATVAGQPGSASQPHVVHKTTPRATPSPSSKPGASPQPALTLSPTVAPAGATPAPSPLAQATPTPSPSPTATTSPSPSPSPAPSRSPIFPPFPPVHLP